jgi:hypothetical protein
MLNLVLILLLYLFVVQLYGVHRLTANHLLDLCSQTEADRSNRHFQVQVRYGAYIFFRRMGLFILKNLLPSPRLGWGS